MKRSPTQMNNEMTFILTWNVKRCMRILSHGYNRLPYYLQEWCTTHVSVWLWKTCLVSQSMGEEINRNKKLDRKWKRLWYVE